MAVLPILEFPDPRLREVARPVERFDASVKKLVDDLAETMYAAPGCGLAATQVGVMLRVFVVDTAVEDEPSDLRAFVNPEIVELSGRQTWNEGCLSFPDIAEEIDRAEKVRVRYLDPDGRPQELVAEGLLAVAIQHENDHLDGVLMIDKMSGLKRRMVTRKMEKRQKSGASVAP